MGGLTWRIIEIIKANLQLKKFLAVYCRIRLY
uniref:Uncharacterized protein n=1 Tax=Siphoviridae sp. ctLqe90 TaxID=2825456 RepID=A0A8S5Q242_9CAUD|nr:MAG TPA: hypothetical protein [Siphoviridae sp. ctLqe90]DAG36075.1 MAG TPA: hypothetical protein [Caudoviricetes sp.]